MAKSFSNMTSLSGDTLMIVDSLNLAFRYKHKGQFNFSEDYIRTVRSLQRSYKASYVVIAADKGGSSYRKELYPAYKENRKEKQALATPEEQAEFELFFEEFKATIQRFREETEFPVLQFEGVEADDIAGYIVKIFKKHFPKITKIVLVSSDKDWDLLISEDVIRFSYVTRKETTVENWSEHYGELDIEELITMKCLQGDSGDNVPGVDGIAEGRAKTLIKTYGCGYDIAAALPIDSKYKYIQNLNKFGSEALLLNYRLMDLLEYCDEALGEANCATIIERLQEYIYEA